MSGSVTPVPPPLASPSVALLSYPSSSAQQLPDACVSIPSPPASVPCSASSFESKTNTDATVLPVSPLAVDFHSEKQQLSCRIQTASTRARLSLTKSTEAAGKVSELSPEEAADLLSTEERSALETDVHLVSQQQLAKRYGTDLVRGLTTAQVGALTVKYGRNVLSPPPSTSYVWLFLNQLVAGFSFILWLAAIVILLSWQPLGSIGGATPQVVNVGVAVVLVMVILISAVFNFYQEVRSIQIVRAFKDIVPSTARVIRDGHEQEVLAAELVPGDLVNLVMGDKVPADVRLLWVSGLQLNLSALTGESEPVTSSTKTTSLNYLDSHNLAFYSALIEQGRGTGLVTATADATVLGQVAQLTQNSGNTDTNLHREIRRFVLFVTVLACLTGILAFILWGAWLHQAHPTYMPPAAIVVNAFSLIVAYVPEGLPVCVTLTLTMVATRMFQQHVLVKNLAIIETFNSVSVIATDKTGTLTMNEMTVQQLVWTASSSSSSSDPTADPTTDPTAAAGGGGSGSGSDSVADAEAAICIVTWTPPADDVSELSQQSVGRSCVGRQMLLGAALCNVAEASVRSDGVASVSGDACDVALYQLLRSKLAVNVLGARQLLPRVRLLPFNSSNKCMISLHCTADGTGLCYMKGAPELLLDRCSHVAEDVLSGVDGLDGVGDMSGGSAGSRGTSGVDGSSTSSITSITSISSMRNSSSSSGGLRVVELTAAKRSALLELQSRYGRSGCRVVGVCMVEWPADSGWAAAAAGSAELEQQGSAELNHLPAAGYTFLGLFALLDPPRPAVRDSVCRAQAAGIRVVMVTGDHPSTAQAIAQQVGIVTAHSTSTTTTSTSGTTTGISTTRAAVRQCRLARDELGRAVMHMTETVDGMAPVVIETHVLGTQEPDHTAVDVKVDVDEGVAVDAAAAVDMQSVEQQQPHQQQQSSKQQPTIRQRHHKPAATSTTTTTGTITAASRTWFAAIASWWQREFGLSVGGGVSVAEPVAAACVLTGQDVRAFDSYMWSWALQHRELVFARTSPEQKLRIVSELQQRGEVVAVTGDGTNDAPAIKQADLGVAMQAGAEVAREAADMILLDNNFASIVAAISQGRLVSDNLKKVCLYLLPGSTWSEMWPVLFNVFLGVPLALSSFQMIILSIVTDVINALALVQEKPEAALMSRPPTVVSDQHLVDWKLLYHAYIELGTICSLSAWFNYIRYFQRRGIAVSDTFLAWTWAGSSCCQLSDSACLASDPSNCYSSGGRIFSLSELSDIQYSGQSIFFVSLLITNFFNLFATRTRYTSFLQHNPLYGAGRNLWLLSATVAGSCVAVLLTQASWFNTVFLTRPVEVRDVAPAIGFGALLFAFDELRKYVLRTYPSSLWAKTAW